MTRQASCFHDDVLPALEKEGIEITRWDDLDDAEHARLRELFRERIFPVLTPLAVDPAHPFPYISGLSLNLAVVVRNPRTATEHFARVKVPPNFARFLPVAEQRFVPLEDVIAAHLAQLFPGMDVLQHHMFRVTRNEDVEVEEDDAENLLTAMERELMRRRFGPAVRLEVEESVDPHVLDLLQRELGVSSHEVLTLLGPLDLTGLFRIAARNTSTVRSSRQRTAICPTSSPHPRRTCSPPSGPATSSYTTLTTRSQRASSGSSNRPRPTPECWRSSRPCTERAETPPSSTH
jgi:polyphosphate kinase